MWQQLTQCSSCLPNHINGFGVPLVFHRAVPFWINNEEKDNISSRKAQEISVSSTQHWQGIKTIIWMGATIIIFSKWNTFDPFTFPSFFCFQAHLHSLHCSRTGKYKTSMFFRLEKLKYDDIAWHVQQRIWKNMNENKYVFNAVKKMELTLSVKVFNETNLNDSTGIRVALCPCDVSSCGIKIQTNKLPVLMYWNSEKQE